MTDQYINNLQDLPDDMLVKEIFPKLDLPTLFQVSKVSKRLASLVQARLSDFLQRGGLKEMTWGPESEFEAAKANPKFREYFIKDFIRRLHDKVDLIGYLDKHPDVLNNWSSGTIAKNNSIYPQDIVNNPNLGGHTGFWKPIDLSLNPNVTPEFVMANPQISWDWDELQKNGNFTFDWIDHNIPASSHLNYSMLSQNTSIILPNVKAEPDDDWNYHYLSNNPNITAEDLHPDGLIDPKNPNNRLEDVFKYEIYNTEDRDESMHALSHHPNISLSDMKENFILGWKPFSVAKHPGISPEEYIKRFPQYKSFFSGLAQNPNLTIDFINKHPEIGTEFVFNNFTRDPNYRKLLYRYIFQLLPENVTITIQDNEMTAPKETIYGLLATVHAFKLDYNIVFLGIPLKSEDYQMFTIGGANQPYLIQINDFPFHFTDYTTFLQGVDQVLKVNNLNIDSYFPGGRFFYDKAKEYEAVDF